MVHESSEFVHIFNQSLIDPATIFNHDRDHDENFEIRV